MIKLISNSDCKNLCDKAVNRNVCNINMFFANCFWLQSKTRLYIVIRIEFGEFGVFSPNQIFPNPLNPKPRVVYFVQFYFHIFQTLSFGAVINYLEGKAGRMTCRGRVTAYPPLSIQDRSSHRRLVICISPNTSPWLPIHIFTPSLLKPSNIRIRASGYTELRCMTSISRRYIASISLSQFYKLHYFFKTALAPFQFPHRIALLNLHWFPTHRHSVPHTKIRLLYTHLHLKIPDVFVICYQRLRNSYT